MALLPSWTGSFDAEPPYSEFRTYAGGTTCVAPITTFHTLAQLIPRDSLTRRHGTYSGKVTLRQGDHINNVCSKDGVQLYGGGPAPNIVNGSEMWYSYSFRFPAGGILSTSFNGMHEFGVGNGFYHPQYLVFALQAGRSGGSINLTLQIQTGHKPGPGASDFNPTAPNGYKAAEVLIGPSGPRPCTFDVWHDFYAHVVFSAYHGLTSGQIDAPGAHTILTGVLEIWHREEGDAWEKIYSNRNNGTALINRAPHPTLNWNSQYGAPGENGSSPGTMHMGFYRDAQAITDTYWVDSWLMRQSEAEILSEFGSSAAVPDPPDPAASHLRIGNASPTSGLTTTLDGDFKRVLKRGIGVGISAACDKGYCYLTGPSSGGSQPLQMIVYDDDAGGGLPGSLKGVSDEVVLAQGAGAAWVSFPFSTPAQITGDQLYFGLISGQGGQSIYNYQNVAGGGYRLGDTYADGPSNPFGASPLVLAIEPGFVLDYTISGDTVAPTLVSATVEASLLMLNFSETLNTTAPSSAAFTVAVNQQVWPLVPMVSISNNSVQLLLANPVLADDIVTVAYTQPGTNDIQDLAGNKAISLTPQSVENTTQAIGSRIINPAQRVAAARRIDPGDRRAGEGGGL